MKLDTRFEGIQELKQELKESLRDKLIDVAEDAIEKQKTTNLSQEKTYQKAPVRENQGFYIIGSSKRFYYFNS